MSNYLEVDGLRVGKNMIRAYRAQIKELEQQLSNSISKDKVRELVEKYDRSEHYSGKNYFDYECAYNDFRREIVKLLTNKEEG